MSSRDEKWKMREERSQGVTGRWSGRVLELVFDYVEMGTLKGFQARKELV